MKNVLFLSVAVIAAQVAWGQARIPADSAAAYIGKEVTVCSKVYGVKSLGSVTLLDLGGAYPKSLLRVAISVKDAATFTNPIFQYNGKEICVTGMLTNYKGKAEIVVTKQEQLRLATPK